MEPQALAAAGVGAASPGADELLTPSQAGDYLRTGERFVRRLIAERSVSYVKLGKYVGFSGRLWTPSSNLLGSPRRRRSTDRRTHPLWRRLRCVSVRRGCACASARRGSACA